MVEQAERERQIGDVLSAWLPRQVAGVSDPSVTAISWSTAGGFSAETVFVDVRWRRHGTEENRPLVLRQQISGHDLLHDASLRFQSEVMKRLAGRDSLPVPVPELLGMEEDETLLGSPFLVMERLPGRIVPQHPNYNVEGWVRELPPPERRSVWQRGIDAMAAVHRLDWRDGFDFMARGKVPGLAGYIEWMEDWYRWAVAGRDFPLGDAGIAYLKREIPTDTPTSVLWGDPIPANTLYGENGEVTGLIDWEMAALGPGEIDLAWWVMFDELFSTGFGIPRLEGLPDRDETIAIYERAAGRPVADFPYYEVLNWMRMTIISMRAVDRQVGLGRFRAANDAWSNNASSAALARHLGLPPVIVGPDFKEFVHQLMARH